LSRIFRIKELAELGGEGRLVFAVEDRFAEETHLQPQIPSSTLFKKNSGDLNSVQFFNSENSAQ
jgi:hypothetical protein